MNVAARDCLLIGASMFRSRSMDLLFSLNLGHRLSKEVHARTIVVTGTSDEGDRTSLLYFRIFGIFVLTEDSSISEK